MRFKIALVLAAVALGGCGSPQAPAAAGTVEKAPEPPPKGYSRLDITINQNDTSDFSFTMRSNAKSSREAIQIAIKDLEEREKVAGQVEKNEK